MINRICFWVSTMLFALNAWAAEVSVSDAWVRATAPGQDSGSIQFSITSQQEAKLVEASSPVAGKVEFHSMSHENGMMEMRPVESIALPAGKTVDLAAGGKHIMLIGLKQPLKVGDSVPFTLTVQYADKSKATVKANAEVKSLTASHEMHPQHDMNDMHDMPGM
jgi:periplasmic copper chaperone A